MKSIQVGIAVAVACSAIPVVAEPAPPEAFAVCAACHTLDGAHGLGPSVKGVFGRTAGTARGFNYSAAMRRAGVVWDDATLDAFIADPQSSIPGNVMPFAGVADAKQRADIVTYLKGLK